MVSQNSEKWFRARRAREDLTRRFIDHPDVSLVEIGLDPEVDDGPIAERLVIRVHIRHPETRLALELPSEIDGIPVRTIVGDYRLQ